MKKLILGLGIAAVVVYFFGRYKKQENVKEIWSSATTKVEPQR